MQNDWLATSSMEQSQQIISAINTLSIQAKLKMAGVENGVPTQEVQQANKNLRKFLNQLKDLVADAEKSRDRVVLGANPRIGKLASNFMDQKKRMSKKSKLYDLSIDRISELLESEDNGDLNLLIECLKGLRTLVEQHAYADVHYLLGEL